MQIQVHTDAHIEGRDALVRWVEAEATEKLARLRDRVTRVEIHFSVTNGDKSSEKHMRCVIEARLSGLPALAASHQAATLADAFSGATAKLRHAMEGSVERIKDRHGRDSIRREGHAEAESVAGADRADDAADDAAEDAADADFGDRGAGTPPRADAA